MDGFIEVTEKRNPNHIMQINSNHIIMITVISDVVFLDLIDDRCIEIVNSYRQLKSKLKIAGATIK